MNANYITIEKIIDLYQIFEEPIFLSGDISQIQKEIYANSWGITLDNEFAKIIKADALAEFILDLVKFRSEEIAMIRPSTKATLYFWFDEFSLQLCFNILSGENRKLPFGCKINIVDSPYPILKEFLKVARNNALYGNYLEFSEITDADKNDPDYGDGSMNLDKITIDVWQINLPWNEEAS
ncbi:MAG: hypothetical protein JO129_03525 [Candidatus Dependentiae bacterium]|nr:hypothetical protein [Candidatus Dependentiae bacterium]